MTCSGLIKFSHTLFALPFALLGAALAAHGPDGWRGRVHDWLGILLCMATARSAAMAFNRLADRRIDALNPRTAARHLPSGRLSVGLGRGSSRRPARPAFVASTLLFLPNRWPLFLSVPVLLWLLGYSYTKRFTSLAHFWLGRVAQPGADRRLDRAAGRPRAGRRSCSAWPSSSGSPGSTSSMPARTSTSTARTGLHSIPGGSASGPPCGWPRPATP